MNCERCGNMRGQPIMLIGGRHTELCTRCLAEWHRHVRGNQAWKEDTRLVATQNTLAGRALAGDAPTKDEWLAYHTAYDANREALFVLADAWLREAREPRKELSDGPALDTDLDVDRPGD